MKWICGTPFPRRRIPQKSRAWPVVLVLALLIVPHPAKGQNQEVQTWKRFEIGNLVLRDLRPGRAFLGAREYIDGIEYQHFHLKASAGTFEYKAPPGTTTNLKGILTNVDIRGLFSRAQVPGVPPLFQVPPGQFKLTMDPEIGRLEGFYGGKVELPGTRVWVENPEEIRLTPTTNAGFLAFRSHPVRLRQIRLDMPVLTEPFRVDLVSVDPNGQGGGRFLFSFADSSLRLVGGKFASGQRPPSTGRLSQKSFDLAFGNASAGYLEAEVSESALAIEFQHFQAKVDALFQFDDTIAPMIAEGSFKIESVRGSSLFAPDRAVMADLELDRINFAPERAPVVSTRAAASSPCEEAASLLTDAEVAFLERRGIPSPMTQRMRSIQTAASGLMALPRTDLALHLPQEKTLGLLRAALGPVGPLVDTIRFGRQELLQCLSPASISPELAELLPVELLIHYGLSIDGKDLVVRPGVRLIRLPGLRLDRPVLLSALLQQLESSTRESSKPISGEVRIPLPFQFREAVDASRINGPGFTVTADPLSAEVAIEGAALLVDENGLHLLATLR